MNSKIISKYIIKNQNSLESNLPILFDYIKKYKLEFLLPEILKNLEKHKNREIEINKNKLITPHKLSLENKESLESKYNLKIDEENLDKNIITGYKIYTRDKIIDASLDTLLKNFIKAN